MRNIIEVANGVTRIEAYRMNEPVTVSIPSDEPLAIIGENGSGKSLLVDILTGAHPLWGTEVKYDFTPSVHKKVSENIKTVTFRDAYGNATGTYYQQRWNQWDVGDSNTVEEVLSNAAASKDISEELNRILGLGDLLHKKMIMLSSGVDSPSPMLSSTATLADPSSIDTNFLLVRSSASSVSRAVLRAMALSQVENWLREGS